MVRAAALGLLLISSAATAQGDPWERYRGVEGGTVWPGRLVAWVGLAATGTTYLAYENEVERVGNHVTVWLHGNHETDATVTYRTSLTRIAFNCLGGHAITAFTSYSAAGETVSDWDGPLYYRPLRPNSVYMSAADRLCHSEPEAK